MSRPRSCIPKHEVKKLIEMVRKYPALYNTRHANYRDMMLHNNMWASIASLMDDPDRDGDAWKKEWRYRRDTYVKKKRQLQSKHGRAKAQRWPYINDLCFLDPFLSSELIVNSVNGDSDEEDLQQEDDVGSMADSPSPTIEAEDEETSSRVTRSSTVPPKYKPSQFLERSRRMLLKRKRLAASNTRHNDRLANHQQEEPQEVLPVLPKPQTQEELFFGHCAMRMAALPLELKATLQVQITQLLFNAENRHLPPMEIAKLPRTASPFPITVSAPMQHSTDQIQDSKPPVTIVWPSAEQAHNAGTPVPVSLQKTDQLSDISLIME